MQTRLRLLAFAAAALVPMALSGDLQAQQAPPQPPQFPNMTFFITSTGGPNGANSAASRAPTSIARRSPPRPAPAPRPGARI